jgi:WD40 repeat protein/DNA-binding SARP family transcriptional activator
VALLVLSLLGGFQVTRAGVAIAAFESNKVRALLAYLAVEADRVHTRSVLAALLWPDHPEEMARANLRHVLRQLRQTLPDPDPDTPLLLTTHQTIQINPACPYTLDVARFTHLLAAARRCPHRVSAVCPDCLARYQEAAELYRGDFLAGFSLYDSEPFDEWLVIQREGFHRQALELFFTLADYYEAQGQFDQAHRYATRQLQLEPWREEAHRQVMRVLALSGQRSVALAQYNQCRKILADELGVEPDAETVALYEQIRAGKFDKVTRWQGGKVTPDPPVTLSPPHPVTLPPLQDWGEAPAASYFYGRQAESEQLKRWLQGEPGAPRAQLIVVLGMGGMGKTTLATAVTRALTTEFAFVFWRSLLNAPLLTELLKPCLQFLAQQQLTVIPGTLDEQLGLLLDYLGRQRCLLVFDNAESILMPDQPGQYRPGYEGYGQLIERVAQRHHQSCLVMTSRERPRGIARLEEDLPIVRTLRLNGLSDEAGQSILKTRGVSGATVHVGALVQRYSGNPLALKLVARTIQELFAGDLNAFLSDETLVFDDIRSVLNQQFARLSSLERQILIWLAVEREAVGLDVLTQDLVWSVTRRDLVEALRALQRRSLLEKNNAGFTLQNVVTEFLTDHLVEQITHEIEQGTIDLLNRYTLLKAQAKEYVRQSQVRLILQPIANQLLTRLGKATLLKQVHQLLAWLHAGAVPVSGGQAPLASGYAGGNLLNLLIHLHINVASFDFSQISVWQAYLRGKYVPGLKLAGADLTGSAFTHIFGNIQGLRFRSNGELLVFGSSDGMARLWLANNGSLLHAVPLPDPTNAFVTLDRDGRVAALGGADHTIILVDLISQTTLYTFSGHHNPIWRLAFHPNRTWAASGDASGQIMVWTTEQGAPLHRLRGHHQPICALAFAPAQDGADLLASADVGGMICLWRFGDNTSLHTFQAHAVEVSMLQFTPDSANLVSSGIDHTVRLWRVQTSGETTLLQTLDRHTQPVWRFAISPNGRILATGGGDNFIILWDVQSGQMLHTLADHAAPLNCLAFSLDSRQLAALDTNETIGVWDANSGQRVDSYHIHHGGIQAVATTGDGKRMVSGGADWAIYIWDISNPVATHMVNRLEGHRQRIMSLAFCRYGMRLASGDQGGEIRLWHIGNATSHLLHGHKGAVYALAWRADGQQLVSAGADGVLCLWNINDKQLAQVLRGHVNLVTCCAFSPDGHWIASGSMDRSVRLWEAKSGQLRYTLHGHTNMVQQVCFTPDGRHLISSSFDETYALWDVATGKQLGNWPTQNTTYLALAIHPNGKIMAAGGRDYLTRLVEIESGQVITELQGHSRTVEALSLCPAPAGGDSTDRQLLVTAGHDETIRLWEVYTTATAPWSATCLATLRAPGPYAGMDITGVTGISDAQKAALKALGAVEG